MTSERWLPVVGYEGLYEVSDLGRIRRSSPGRKTRVGLVLKQRVGTTGYLEVALHRDRRQRTTKVHRVVALAFLGPAPDGRNTVRHLDDHSSNNVPANLAWGTQGDNIADQVRNGIHPMARKTHCKNGHELSGENVAVSAKGWRNCMPCIRDRQTRYRAQRKEKAA